MSRERKMARRDERGGLSKKGRGGGGREEIKEQDTER
jgi:hypothetical protein